VSVGNIGQLVIDLLMTNVTSSSRVKKVGRIFHSSLEPVVGSDIHLPKGVPPGLMTACEVFLVEDRKYVVVHFHSPVTMRGRQDFVKSFVGWIQDQKFSQVVCFGSIFAADRTDLQLIGVPIRYLATGGSSESITSKLRELELRRLEKRQFPAPAILDENYSLEDNKGVLHVPGGGITKPLFELCDKRGIPFVALLMFTSDGENSPEAISLFQMADKAFGFVDGSRSASETNKDAAKKLLIPVSWSSFRNDPELVALY